jgi:hypothetical protein
MYKSKLAQPDSRKHDLSKGVTMARVLLGVKQMNTPARAEKVKALLMSLEGVNKVEAGADEQATITYNEEVISVMDLIRALGEKGLQAGME